MSIVFGVRGDRAATAIPGLLSLLLLVIGASCRPSVPVAAVTCQTAKLGRSGALPLLIDGQLWLASLAGDGMTVSPAVGSNARSFTSNLSGATGTWRFVNAVVKPTGSALVFVMRAGCYSDCSASILEVFPTEGRVAELWEGQVVDGGYTLQVLLPTNEPVLLAVMEWLVLRDGQMQPLCRRTSGKGIWSGPSGVGYVLDDRVSIVGPSGSAVDWRPPSGSSVGSAGYAGGGQIGIVLHDGRGGESLLVITEDGKQIGEPQRLGGCWGWGVTSFGAFAVVSCDDRIRRLTNGTLGPEMSLGRPETLIPIAGWSRDAMAFRGTDEVCVVR